MRTTVLITNYNYGRFLSECLESVLQQSTAADQIIVVDDGSTDDSREILEKFAKEHASIELHFQTNTGQTAAMALGMEKAIGDLVFFLDADDRYLPQHIESVKRTFAEQPEADLIFTAYKVFGERQGNVISRSESGFLGELALAAIFAQYWATGQTSLLCLRRSLVEKLLPYPEHWLTQGKLAGDPCLVLGASVLGARQYYLRDVQVEYRIHPENYSKQFSDSQKAYWTMRRNHEIVEHYRQKVGLPLTFSREALAEFKTWTKPTEAEYKCYRDVIWASHMGFFRKLEHLRRARKHYADSL